MLHKQSQKDAWAYDAKLVDLGLSFFIDRKETDAEAFAPDNFGTKAYGKVYRRKYFHWIPTDREKALLSVTDLRLMILSLERDVTSPTLSTFSPWVQSSLKLLSG